MSDFVRVAAVAEIPAGEGRTVEVSGRQIALFNSGGEFYAIDNICKHKGGPLGEGELDDKTVLCPLHGWAYDITSGECLEDDACSVERFEIKVENGEVWVRA
ncbi:MAG: nitrite reductase small subunit NirD [Deltaproteobacteria bacterium]|nr:nitrite reductase small subunit NirD [Deltaproteobacteria bacterium]